MITLSRSIAIGVSIGVGALGGGLAKLLGAPLPFLLGSLAATALLSMIAPKISAINPELPASLRSVFVAVIGVMIGASFTSNFVETLSTLWVVAIAVVFFVIMAFLSNYIVFKYLGKLDRNTAFFAAMPGGLVDSVTFGEKVGADVQILTLLQFSRIILVITSLPFIFLLWTGQVVGSAAGVTLVSGQSIALADALILGSAGLVGYFGGRALNLPAYILVGPLVASAAVHIGGLTSATVPAWLFMTAQVIVGAGLGVRFGGFGLSSILRTIGLSIVSVTLMLTIDALFVLVLVHIQDQPFSVLLISLAPGGVTETSLIALSLGANPVFVSTLHILRIVVTVLLCNFGYRVLRD